MSTLTNHDTQASLISLATTITTDEKRFFTEDNFQKIKRLQQEIHNILDMSPSIRKIINTLITDDNLAKVKAQLLETHSE